MAEKRRLETAALCINNAVGYAGSSALPLWLAALIHAGRLSTQKTGWLASGEMLCLALSVLATSAWTKAASPRCIAVAVAALIVLANTLAMVPMLPALVFGRLLSGAAMGTLLSIVTRVAARRRDAQRVLSLMQAAMVVLVSVLFFVSPILISRFGPTSLFAVIAIAGLAAVLVSVPGLSASAAPSLETQRAASSRTLAPLIGCLALFLVLVGQSSVWNYIVIIGNALGIQGKTLGTLLAIVPPLAMLGPLAAHTLGERVGLLVPLLTGVVVLGVDSLLLVRAHAPPVFCLTAALLNVSILFCVPYAIAFISRLDPSGGFAAAAPAFMMSAGAVSPPLGSRVLEFAGFHSLAYITAVCVVASLVLFASAGLLGGMKAAPVLR